MSITGEERRRLLVHGMVQGVGFRPFLYRLAVAAGLTGFVRNTAFGVMIEVQGEADRILRFSQSLRDAPPFARIMSIQESLVATIAEERFVIADSIAGGEVATLLPPDSALCADCHRELLDPANRRFRYPFINCTLCGPRYTIVNRLPYDRRSTSMHSFTMCPECEREYHDSLDRRFHAQSNCCPTCGPTLLLLDKDGKEIAGDAVVAAITLLEKGMILALKGIGGFHLAVDARSERAVRRLRERKAREAKPFALMMRDIAVVQRHCEVSDGENEALISPEAPIVLLKKRSEMQLAPSIAPGNDRLGVMLPYTPLHTLLFEAGFDVLVMTSANVSDEPMVSDNGEALSRLAGIADAFLLHNRPILLACDDSVTIHLAGKLRQIRRSRGYAPAPMVLRNAGATLLGVGGELKNTVTLVHGTHALMSQHLGDLKNFEAYRHFEQVVAHMQHIFQATPALVVHDLHPAYLSRQWAERQPLPTLGVQHHHAHLVACLAEHGVDEPALGLILDGAGYGSDGTMWGGELLFGNAAGFERLASLELMPLAGGDAAVRQPWRAAVGYLHRSFSALPELPFMQGKAIAPLLELLDKRINLVETSSCGRLFDVVAALCNLCCETTYEGEAAIALMQAAGGSVGHEGFRAELRPCREATISTTPRPSLHGGTAQPLWIIGIASMLQDIVSALQAGMSVREISRRFHRTLVNAFRESIEKTSSATGITIVALSGGVFQNELLFETLLCELRQSGFTVLTHALVPPNDGGLSLGQALIGRHVLER